MKLLLLASIAVLAMGCDLTGQQAQPSNNPAPVAPTLPDDTYSIELCPANTMNGVPEYALCIDKELYGVSTSNGGFMYPLPAGVYHLGSVQMGNQCNFTIGTKCNVIMN